MIPIDNHEENKTSGLEHFLIQNQNPRWILTHLIEMEEKLQKKWEKEKIFEQDAPEEGKEKKGLLYFSLPL
jgi:leucyl-tRNA synthetase